MRAIKFIFILCSANLFCPVIHAQEIKPNIIFILADDLGYGDISGYNKDAKTFTPNIDKLAGEGMSFADAHSSSAVCSPSRYSILTGRYAWRSKLKSGVLGIYDPPLIEKDRLTVPEMLKQKDYRTACIGKWHLGWDWPLINGGFYQDSFKKSDKSEKARLRIEQQIDFNSPILNGPLSKGFDYYFGTDVPNYPPYGFIENDKLQHIPSLLKPDSMYGHPGVMIPDWTLENIMPSLTARAVGYIKDNAKEKNNKPFFLYLPLTAPHTPIAPARDFKGKSKAGFYGDYVQEVDWTVGEILKAIKEAGIANNTIVIFTSDNGSPARDGTAMSGDLRSVNRYGHFPSGDFKGIKADIWEGGHHIPFIVRWQGKVEKNSVCKKTICLSDFMATCADLFHIKLPDNAGVDSYSLLPLLLNKSNNIYSREITIHHSSGGYFSIRKENWKLIMCAGSGGWSFPTPGKDEAGLPDIQLYDMNTDPGEKNNLQAVNPAKVTELKNLLIKIIKEGRSTAGPVQENVENFYPHTKKWLNE